jgi:hypothetical protein
MMQGWEWVHDDSFWVINEKYYPASTDTSPTFSCNDTFTAFQTAVNDGTSYFAEPFELAPMTSDYPLLASYSYLSITSVPVDPTYQIVSSSSKATNILSTKPGSHLMSQLEVALTR